MATSRGNGSRSRRRFGNVAEGQEVWLRWSDVDHTGNDHGMAIDDLVITANGSSVDPAPTVVATSPANNASGVSIGSNIVIHFNESVIAGSGAFAIDCGALQSFALNGSPGSSHLNPDADCLQLGLHGERDGSQVSDAKHDPDDKMGPATLLVHDAGHRFLGGCDHHEIAAVPLADRAECELFDGAPARIRSMASSCSSHATWQPARCSRSSPMRRSISMATTDATVLTLGNPIPGLPEFHRGISDSCRTGADAVAIFTGNAETFPLAPAPKPTCRTRSSTDRRCGRPVWLPLGSRQSRSMRTRRVAPSSRTSDARRQWARANSLSAERYD